MKVNKVNWAKCPECKVLLNGYQFYPANVLMSGSGGYVRFNCAKCKKELLLKCKVEVTFDCEKVE